MLRIGEAKKKQKNNKFLTILDVNVDKIVISNLVEIKNISGI